MAKNEMKPKKMLLFVDDKQNIENTVMYLQIQEFRRFFEEDHNLEDVDIEDYTFEFEEDEFEYLDDEGNLRDRANEEIKNKLTRLLDKINNITQVLIKGDYNKIEVVMDLCLCLKDRNPADEKTKLGMKLTKYLLSHMDHRNCYEEGKFLVTLVSNYMSNYNSFCKEYFTPYDLERIEACYRPIEDYGRKSVIDRDGAAYPTYYNKYKFQIAEGDKEGRIKEHINALLQGGDHRKTKESGTYYGNFFGMIYARLYRENEG